MHYRGATIQLFDEVAPFSFPAIYTKQGQGDRARQFSRSTSHAAPSNLSERNMRDWDKREVCKVPKRELRSKIKSCASCGIVEVG